jgi:general secretion pathway protein M
MTARFTQFWVDRSLREQQLLGVMCALLALVVIGLGIIRPIAKATETAQARLDRVSLESGQIRAAADRLKTAQKDAPPPATAALSVVVSQSASAAGFTLAMLDAQGEDRIGITVPSAKSPALFAWLALLAKQGILVERMTIRTGGDATLAVDATLRQRAR